MTTEDSWKGRFDRFVDW